MRTLHITKYYPPYSGGIENFCRDVACEMARQESEQAVLYHGDAKGDVIDGVRLYGARSYGDIMYAPVSPTFPYVFAKVCRDFRPNVLHVHMPNVSAFWPLLMGTRIPIVVHWHSDVIFPPEKWHCRAAYLAYSRLEQALLRKAIAIVATSPPYLESSLPLRSHLDKCRVIPLGLDAERMSPEPSDRVLARERWLLPGTTRLVSAAGRFSHYKGFEYLIKASQHVSDTTFVIAGKGETHEAMADLVRSFGVGDRVRLPGFVDDRALHELMACSDLFCLPSVERSEAFGVVQLEAMFYEIPLVSTSISGSGTGWVNKDGVTGRVVEPRNVNALALSLSELLDDSSELKQCGQAARHRLDVDFSIDAVSRQLLSLYEECC